MRVNLLPVFQQLTSMIALFDFMKIDSTTDLVFTSIPDRKMWNNKQKEITFTELISNCFVTWRDVFMTNMLSNGNLHKLEFFSSSISSSCSNWDFMITLFPDFLLYYLILQDLLNHFSNCSDLFPIKNDDTGPKMAAIFKRVTSGWRFDTWLLRISPGLNAN